jgi:hypothetical protein
VRLAPKNRVRARSFCLFVGVLVVVGVCFVCWCVGVGLWLLCGVVVVVSSCVPHPLPPPRGRQPLFCFAGICAAIAKYCPA